MGFFITALIMFCFWVLLSGYFDAFHFVTGALSSLLVAWLSYDLLAGRKPPIAREVMRVLRFIRYLPWLLWEVFKANIDLVYRTLHPRMPINPSIITFENNFSEDMGTTTLANSITLTPGTVTVDANEEVFVVHAISDEAAESLLEGAMSRQVKKIEKGMRDV